jgi:hypothetical protein
MSVTKAMWEIDPETKRKVSFWFVSDECGTSFGCALPIFGLDKSGSDILTDTKRYLLAYLAL